jgi:hypothetical protein
VGSRRAIVNRLSHEHASDELPKVLIPYDRKEAFSLAHAAEVAGRSVGTIRNWCIMHSLGRRVGGGPWEVSRVALAMFLDADESALRAYHAGDRSSEIVVGYYRRLGLRLANGSA